MNLNYPILMHTSLFIKGNLESEDRISYISEKAFDTGYLSGAIIFDSYGMKYEITQTKKIPLHDLPFPKFLKNILKHFGGHYVASKKNRSIWVVFEVNPIRKFNLDEIKKELTELFLNNPKWFKNSDFSQKQAIELFINEARTVKELIKNISVWS